MKVVLSLALTMFGLTAVTPAFGDVLTCGKDVIVNSDSTYARFAGLDPDCYGRGVEPAVVVSSKERREAAEARIRILESELKKAVEPAVVIPESSRKRHEAAEARIRILESESKKAMDELKKLAALRAKPAIKPPVVKTTLTAKKATTVAGKKKSGPPTPSWVWIMIGVVLIAILASLLAKVAENFPSRLIMKGGRRAAAPAGPTAPPNPEAPPAPENATPPDTPAPAEEQSVDEKPPTEPDEPSTPSTTSGVSTSRR
ncbi:MAG: hypothetical protein HYY55_01540 [Candidatus Niyogibacteria bacterium]|nr:MAG: hypothetical protein HYY55_01540 [Candidatus Niyogibacteria bacterium]